MATFCARVMAMRCLHFKQRFELAGRGTVVTVDFEDRDDIPQPGDVILLDCGRDPDGPFIVQGVERAYKLMDPPIPSKEFGIMLKQIYPQQILARVQDLEKAIVAVAAELPDLPGHKKIHAMLRQAVPTLPPKTGKLKL